ncbi:hypothetical protein AWB78_05331 [Caballeronia calidae]|uniref:Uncharacterized protein n=2 Tax=Caballeronia calidae TaxID=1777139 RepID=A0A158DL68_9BURK|nr:hypothetical protein AWB78_05331 [Caballeronia calidae]
MNSLLSKIGLDNGYNRRINIEMFADRDATVEEPAINGREAVPAREGHDGAAFVIAETSQEAVEQYFALRASGHNLLDSFAQAFKPYFIADHDVTDYIAAAANLESTAGFSSMLTNARIKAAQDRAAVAQAAADEAQAKADASKVESVQKALEANATATQKEADEAQAYADSVKAKADGLAEASE